MPVCASFQDTESIGPSCPMRWYGTPPIHHEPAKGTSDTAVMAE